MGQIPLTPNVYSTLTNQLTLWNEVRLQKLTVAWLVMKCAISYGRSGFVTAVPALNQVNPVHPFLHDCYKIHFNIIVSSTYRFLSGLFFSDFPTKMFYVVIISLCVLRAPSISYVFSLVFTEIECTQHVPTASLQEIQK
jgi:hypothetical protein